MFYACMDTEWMVIRQSRFYDSFLFFSFLFFFFFEHEESAPLDLFASFLLSLPRA